MDTFWSHHERKRGFLPTFFLGAACALTLHSITPVPPAAAQGTIGLYTDASGGTCSFSGNDPGIITAYVVVRPVNGMSAVQFAAPVPECLGATYINETVTPGMLAIGNSQTGISIALTNCLGGTVNVLAITYQRSGSTVPCCEYTIVADPELGHISGVDCWYQEFPLVPTTSHFHADASCECAGNGPPAFPAEPSPYDGDPAASVYSSFSWLGSDPDGNLAE